MLDSLQQRRHELLLALRSGKLSQLRHSLMFGTWGHIGSGLSHRRSVAPVILTRQHEDRVFLNIDLPNPATNVPTSEVKIQVAVENAVGSGGVEVQMSWRLTRGAVGHIICEALGFAVW